MNPISEIPMTPLNDIDILKAALYTACAQLAWHQGKRGNVGHIVHSARECLALVVEPDERERTEQKIEKMNQM